MTQAISTSALCKQFGSQLVVDHLDLDVPGGAVYGFLGPNGSGKTTTIRMLLGLVQPTAGSAHLLGHPIPRATSSVLPRVGALIEGPAFHPYLSGADNLARLDAADASVDPATANHRIAAALDRVGLTAAAGKRYRAYSLGMRQRLSIAAALLRPRDLLVLDEPTNGLDPQGTREVRTLIRELAGEGLTVFLSSHLLAEVEQICSHVGVMSVGRLVYQGRLEDLHARGGRRLQVITPDPDPALAVLTRLGARDVRPGERTADGVVLNLSLDGLAPEDVAVALVQAAVRLRGLTVLGAALEDVFVELTGEGFDVAQ